MKRFARKMINNSQNMALLSILLDFSAKLEDLMHIRELTPWLLKIRYLAWKAGVPEALATIVTSTAG